MRLVLCLSFLLVGCGSAEAPDATSPPPIPQASGEAGQQTQSAAAAQGAADPASVELEPGGTTFEPPVQPEQIPEGAWYCDMGTVHYARPDEGDGSCPVCGMKLVQRGS